MRTIPIPPPGESGGRIPVGQSSSKKALAVMIIPGIVNIGDTGENVTKRDLR